MNITKRIVEKTGKKFIQITKTSRFIHFKQKSKKYALEERLVLVKITYLYINVVNISCFSALLSI